MKIPNIQIQQTIHQRMHTILKIDIKRCEQISAIAQGIIVASTACLALPHPLGIIIAGVSLLSSVMIAFPNFIRLSSSEEISTQSTGDSNISQRIESPTTSSIHNEKKASISSHEKWRRHDYSSTLFPKDQSATQSWANKENRRSSEYWREYIDNPKSLMTTHENVGSRGTSETPLTERIEEVLKSSVVTRPNKTDRVPVGI